MIKQRHLQEKIPLKSRTSLDNFNDEPFFSFKYLQSVSFEDCMDAYFLKEFVFRLQKLSLLGWKQISVSKRHSFGMEKLPREIIKPQLPVEVTPETPLFAFRASGNNLPFIGIRKDNMFYIIFIETKFGDIYKH